MELIEQAVEENADNGPPEHAWANVAPEVEHNRLVDEQEGIQVIRDIQQEDLDANAAMFQTPRNERSGELALRYEAQTSKAIIQSKTYRAMVRSLNAKQRAVVFYHRKWCKETALAKKKQLFPTDCWIIIYNDCVNSIHEYTL